MAEEELYKAIDGERKKFVDHYYATTISTIVIAILVGISILWDEFFFLSHEGRGLPMEVVSVYLFFIVTSIPNIYQSLKQYKFALKLTERLKESVISSAFDLLDFYDEIYRVRRNVTLFQFFVIFVYLLSWFSWASARLPWDLSFILFLVPFAASFIICIAYVLFVEKWKKRNKARRNIQKIMEEYLQKQEQTGS